MKCPNCGTSAPPGIGFGNMCVKYKTFICDLCKTSHQAISHRVKSFSMSAWTMDEVMELTIERNGGNYVALHVWLGNAPPPGGKYPGGYRPKEGDRVEIFKQFITDCYEHGKFRSNTPFDPSTAPTESCTLNQKPSTESRSNTPAKAERRETPPPSAQRRQQPPAVQPTQEVDLLAFGYDDFGDFSDHTSQPSFDQLLSQPAEKDGHALLTPAAVARDDFLCDFSDFASAAPLPPTFAPPLPKFAPPLPTFDIFGSTVSSDASVNNNNSLLQPYVQTYAVSHNSSFDPFCSTIHNSVSMPSFSTVPAEPALQNSYSSGQGQGQQSRPKSNLDLASLYDQKLPQSKSDIPIQPYQGMVGMQLLSSSDAISGIGGGMMYGQSQGSSSNYSVNHLPYQQQQQQQQQQFQHMNGGHDNSSSSVGMMNMSASIAGGGIMGGGWKNPHALSVNGNSYSQQNQTYNNNNQQYQQSQSQYLPQQPTTQNHQQVYRGMPSTQPSVLKGPVDVFDFVGSALMTQLHSNTGTHGGLSIHLSALQNQCPCFSIFSCDCFFAPL